VAGCVRGILARRFAFGKRVESLAAIGTLPDVLPITEIVEQRYVSISGYREIVRFEG
jgi:hypothetical protein